MLLDPESDAESVARHFNMRPHPEGGSYVEVYRSAAADGERPALSTIYFLLRRGERSHWHAVDADEVWLWHAGAPVRLRLSDSAGASQQGMSVGPAVEHGARPHCVVPAGVWQSAESAGAWSLVTCVVAPAFHFAGFRLARPGREPGRELGRDPGRELP